MAKFAYSSLFPSAIVGAQFDAEIDTQARAGRVSYMLSTAVLACYGVALPASKAAFLKFRTAHVAYAAMAQAAREGLDNPPALWVKGHVKRAALYAALDAVACGLTACEKMADSADWAVIFAPIKAAKAATVAKPLASVLTVSPETVTPGDGDAASTVKTVATLATFATTAAPATAAPATFATGNLNVSATIALIESGLISVEDMLALRNAIESHDIKIVMASIETDIQEQEQEQEQEQAQEYAYALV